MADLLTTANAISNWPVTLPKPVQDAIQLFDESAYVDYEALPPKVDSITLKNLPDLVTEYARERAVQAVWNDAKHMVRSQLAQQVLRAAQEHAEAIRKSESVEFNKVVKTFVENAALLPESLDAGDLIRAGGSAVSAYHVAADAAVQLGKWDSWVASLYGLPKWANNIIDPDLRIIEPSSRKQYQQLVNAPTDSGIPGNYLYAAKNGLAFKLHLPDEVTELRDRLNSEEAESFFPGMARIVDGQIRKADGVTPVGA